LESLIADARCLVNFEKQHGAIPHMAVDKVVRR
jgi:hypothetical protein